MFRGTVNEIASLNIPCTNDFTELTIQYRSPPRAALQLSGYNSTAYNIKGS